ncbi:MAG TPA: methyl-accepting chemotaxis protein [Bacillota bacterium]
MIAGKGFAVVAEEVRKLAERSSRATREIGDLVGGMQQGTARAVKAMCSARETSNVAWSWPARPERRSI